MDVRPSFVRRDADEKEARKWGRGREEVREREERAWWRGAEGARCVEWYRAFPVPKGKRNMDGRVYVLGCVSWGLQY